MRNWFEADEYEPYDYKDIYGTKYQVKPAHPYAEQSRDIPLHWNPHYTEQDFDHAQLIFGTDKLPQNGEWMYSDRLYFANPTLWEYSERKANEARPKLRPHSADWFEFLLSTYYIKKVRLLGVQAGVNRSNGFLYQVFGFAFEDNQ